MPIPYDTFAPSGLFATFSRNEKGRDFVVGDIHGDLDCLKQLLEMANFDVSTDRLFAVGDLIGDGPESIAVLGYLNHPWFHSVRGDVEMACLDDEMRADACCGSRWFQSLPQGHRTLITNLVRRLPIAFEVELRNHQHVGVIHSECPLPSWSLLRRALSDPLESSDAVHTEIAARTAALVDDDWSMDAVEHNHQLVADIDRVFVGHAPVSDVTQMGNTVYLDTGACQNRGGLSLVNLETLETLRLRAA